MANQVYSQQFENGLTLLAEPMDWLESVAFTLLIPSGADRDPKQLAGLSNFVCEMAQRGCGSRSSRQFIEDLELLGVDSSGSVSNGFTSYGGSMPAEKLRDALTIYADVARRPHLNDDQFDDAQQVCIQEVRSHDDDLAHQVMTELRRHRYADPYSRVSYGNIEAIQQIKIDHVREHFGTFYQPQGAILSVAGKIDWQSLCDHVGQLFSDWTGSDQPIEETPAPAAPYFHIDHDSSQTHLAVSYQSVPYSHDDYFQSHGAVGVLSGGMSSRLFTEIREKRGLCYSVYASCETVRTRGAIVSYAGTTTERAQETLDVLVHELLRLQEGVREQELQRLKARIKSQLIMAQESSSARSSQIAWDWYHLNRIRALDELSAIIDALTCQTINQYLVDNPPRDFRVVTLGAKQLEIPRGIS
ncbi:MAG: pitrilysin family protein [Planctomycetota bacterium]|nr:pitrilysin family protein [Planctomycetota bacterium]